MLPAATRPPTCRCRGRAVAAAARSSWRPPNPTAALHQLTGWAMQHGTTLAGLAVDRPSLEDVYLRLTSDGAPAGEPERTTR